MKIYLILLEKIVSILLTPVVIIVLLSLIWYKHSSYKTIPTEQLDDYLAPLLDPTADGCSIEIRAQLPDSEDPDAQFNWTTGSAGHSYIVLSSWCTEDTIVRAIGIYPGTEWSNIFLRGPIPVIFADNQQTPYNASYSLLISPEQMAYLVEQILFLADTLEYDLESSNCTDFALGCFNGLHVDELQVQPATDLFSGHSINTPQSLYAALCVKKTRDTLHARNIAILSEK